MKRDALTADDLLRLQEDVDRKRPRLAAHTIVRRRDDSDAESDSVSDFEGSEKASESGDQSHNGSPKEDADEEDEEGSGNESHSEDEESSIPPLDSRFESSRISVVPRSAAQNNIASNKAPAPPAATSFSSLGISSALLSALSKMAIRTPTEVQAACIPPLLQGEYRPSESKAFSDIFRLKGRDCIGNAKTGSGKTIAFALPILQKLSVDPYGIFALVLTPTRYVSSLSFQ